jgi:hypothetical protein
MITDPIFYRLFGLVQKAWFSGYSTDPERGCPGKWIWQVGFG